MNRVKSIYRASINDERTWDLTLLAFENDLTNHLTYLLLLKNLQLTGLAGFHLTKYAVKFFYITVKSATAECLSSESQKIVLVIPLIYVSALDVMEHFYI